MEIEEKKVIDEIKYQKTQIEELRNRIFKLELEYNEKIESFEKRELRLETITSKYNKYVNDLNEKTVLIIGDKSIPIFKSTILDNIYISHKFLEFFNEQSSKEIIIDHDNKYFYEILNIIHKGNNYFMLSSEEKESISREFSLYVKSNEKDSLFLNVLSEFFKNEYIGSIISDFNLNMKYVIFNKDDFIKSVSLNNSETSFTSLKSYQFDSNGKDYNQIFNEKNKKAFFVDYNKELIIEFQDFIRIDSLSLRPFLENNGLFYPTSGSYYASLHISKNGITYDFIAKMPSSYGSSTDEYITKLNFGAYKTIRFLKFTTDSSSQFSLNYIKID